MIYKITPPPVGPKTCALHRSFQMGTYLLVFAFTNYKLSGKFTSGDRFTNKLPQTVKRE